VANDLIVVGGAIGDLIVYEENAGHVIGDPGKARAAANLVAEDIDDIWRGFGSPVESDLVVASGDRIEGRRRRLGTGTVAGDVVGGTGAARGIADAVAVEGGGDLAGMGGAVGEVAVIVIDRERFSSYCRRCSRQRSMWGLCGNT
jgi:hypothetical protein